RNSDHNPGAAAVSADDLQRPAGPGRALIHEAYAQVPGEAAVGVEPDSVVSDLQHHRVSVRLQVDVDAPRAGVLTVFQSPSRPIRCSACLTSMGSSGSVQAMSWAEIWCLAPTAPICLLRAATRPSVSRAPGRSSKISVLISAWLASASRMTSSI